MSASEDALKAPFPWFGGKSRIAAEVWRRLGDTPNYVEPFLGSAAMLLARPPSNGGRIETVNDYDAHVANFWRSVQADPEAVAHYAGNMVSELDLHARGDWLFYRPSVREWVEQLRADPGYYDAKSAGWWVWFVSCWIGNLPDMNRSAGRGVNRKLPHLGNAGRGVNRKLPHLGSAGQGVKRQLPHLGNAGRGVKRTTNGALVDYIRALAERFERVRVCCGDWARVVTPAVTTAHGLTAVFLDPPYSGEERNKNLYSVDDHTVAADVREWAIANGDNPLMRIALCGYDTEHGDHMPDNWTAHRWKAQGGYGGQGNGNGKTNATREVVWFSPYCLNQANDEPLPLFSNGSNK